MLNKFTHILFIPMTIAYHIMWYKIDIENNSKQT